MIHKRMTYVEIHKEDNEFWLISLVLYVIHFFCINKQMIYTTHPANAA